MGAKLKVGAAETAQRRGDAAPPGAIFPETGLPPKIPSVLSLARAAGKMGAKLEDRAAETEN